MNDKLKSLELSQKILENKLTSLELKEGIPNTLNSLASTNTQKANNPSQNGIYLILRILVFKIIEHVR